MRRTRIKGIANIPQRKRTDQPQKPEDIKFQPEVSIAADDSEADNCMIDHLSENIEAGKRSINEIIQEVKSVGNKFDNEPTNSFGSEGNESDKTIKKELISVLENVLVKSASSETENFSSDQIQNQAQINIVKNVCKESEIKIPPSRRRAIKPNVSVHAINRRTDVKTVLNDRERTSYQDPTAVKVEGYLNETEESFEQKIENISSEIKSDVLPLHSSPANNIATLPESRKLKSPINIPLVLKKTASSHSNAGSDCEYPHPPASPNKLNRSRIKAVPRIGYRKISFSASESEDESKKVDYKTRNDYQSSNFSGVHEPVTEQPSTLKVKEFSSVIQRKCKRTEWSRKLVEARREFTRKFMTAKPDHKKLTMIDLIFYNPTTNAMKNEKSTVSQTEFRSELRNEEEVDNPSEVDDDTANKDDSSKKSDEENEIPAPQIRIGPSGEIILDEKSLVIENKQTKINREQLQKSRIVDGNSDRPYGVFKKVKRSKDWSHSETLRFYKALSTIGTDFSLMCELFPNRTRRELKMKFKKEEKINQALIDKAVMEPCSFDFEELKKEFELVEIEKKELEQQKIETEKLKKSKGIKRSIKFLKFTQKNDTIEKESTTGTINLTLDKSDGEFQPELQENWGMNMNLIDTTKVKKQQRKPKVLDHMKKNEQKKFDIMSVLSDSDSASSDLEESEVVWRPVQTRYGRKTRKRQIYEPDLRMQEEFIVPRKIQKPNICNDPSQKPGSLMMISSKTPDGQPIVQIFMVTDKKVQNGKEIQGVEDDLNTENLLPIAMIKTGHTDDEEEEELIENNYTIPAEPQEQNLGKREDSENVDKVDNIQNKIDDTAET